MEVSEVRVERTTRTGSKKRDGVKVLIKETSRYSGYAEGDEVVVLPSHLIQKWTDYQEELELEEKRTQVRKAQFEKVQEQSKHLKELFESRGIEIANCNPGIYSGDHVPDTSLRLSNDSVLKIMALLEALPAGEIKLEQPGSALDKLFG